ncbi:MAG: hypothetical protein HWN65_10030 [Candidatus Helarchaeota archaeon]|nr:hypothetical protein [Candidatus Helarchaeota archaeon]
MSSKKKRDEYLRKMKEGCYIGVQSFPNLTRGERVEIEQKCNDEAERDRDEREFGCAVEHNDDKILKQWRTSRCVDKRLEKTPFDPFQYTSIEGQKVVDQRKAEEDRKKETPAMKELRILSESAWDRPRGNHAKITSAKTGESTFTPTEVEFNSDSPKKGSETTLSFSNENKVQKVNNTLEIQDMTKEGQYGKVFRTPKSERMKRDKKSPKSQEPNELKFRGIRIRCPICGRQQMFRRRSDGLYVNPNGSKIRLDEEGYLVCTNPDCKLEFLFDTKLSRSELELVDRVLKVGHKKWWKVDLSISGGSRINRSAMGADFLIHRMGGGALWIEFKRNSEFGFTYDQLTRFRKSVDSKEVATRFIGLIPSQKDKALNTQLYFWTPAFFRMIPPESFKITEKAEKGVSKGKEGLVLEGLEDFIVNNSFTLRPSEKSFPISSDIMQELQEIPNLSLFNVLKGRAFWYGVLYEEFDWDVAAEILIEKLRSTLNNLDEDIIWQRGNPYIMGKKVVPFRVIAEPKIMTLILNEINNSYRPLYPAEIALRIQRDQDLAPYLTWDEGTSYIKSIKEGQAPALFSRSVFQFCEKLVRRGKLDVIKHRFSNRQHLVSYFPKKRRYIILTYIASRSLDLMKEFLERRLIKIIQTEGLDLSELKRLPNFNEICRNQFPITLRVLARELSWDYQVLRMMIRDRERNELAENNLIHEQLGGVRRRSVLLSLTEKGIEYVTRTGQFYVK